MTFLLNLSIRNKLITIVAVGVVGMVVTLLFNYTVASRNHSNLLKVRDIHFPTLERVDANLVRLDTIEDDFTNAVVMGDEELLEEAEHLAAEMISIFQEISEINRDLGSEIDTLAKELNAYITVALALSRGMLEETLPAEHIKSKTEEMNAHLDRLKTDLNRFREKSYSQFTGAIDAVNSASKIALQTGLGIGLVTAAILILIGLLIGRIITCNICGVVQSLEEMVRGDGDLTKRLVAKSNDEVGKLVDRFNAFIDKLQGIIRDVSDTSTMVTDAAKKMEKVSKMSAAGMVAQQSEIDQVVTSMAEMTASVEDVAKSAGDAATTAGRVKDDADSAQEVVRQNMEAIDRLASDVESAAEVIRALDSHSEAIGTVLNVIRDIAEQTNLLALNAAIEAARAGEQGRGFAVVADEVRTLATRTHDSTREINDMITRLQSGTQNAVQSMSKGREQAKASVEKARHVTDALQRIVDGIEAINGVNTQIASAAEEQAAAVKEINNNIINLGQVVTQVAEGARDAEHDGEQLAGLADRLREQVSIFRV